MILSCAIYGKGEDGDLRERSGVPPFFIRSPDIRDKKWAACPPFGARGPFFVSALKKLMVSSQNLKWNCLRSCDKMVLT